VRLFIALQIPPAVRKSLAEFLATLRALSSQPRWVRAENLHVTLKFIGEVQAEKLGDIRVALSAVHSDRLVTLDFRGLGFFPNEKRPRFSGPASRRRRICRHSRTTSTAPWRNLVFRRRSGRFRRI